MERALSLTARSAGVVGAALLGFAGSPGIAGPGGSAVLAVLGVALWAWTVAHPLGPRRRTALLVEWLGGALAGGLMMWWVTYVVAAGVLYIGAGFGVYALGMGVVLRRLEGRLPFPLATALAWTGLETLRAMLAPPLGLGWFRLGFYAHDDLWLSGSARVFGVEGLSIVLAALAGGLAELARERRVRPAVLVSALAPLLVAAAAAALVRAPETVDGPRVLLVQPGYSQERKQHDDEVTNFRGSRDQTHRAAAEAGAVDLVCWGETMLYVPLFTPEAEAALRSGTAHQPSWHQLEPELVDRWHEIEEMWVHDELMELRRKTRRFPAGASFAVGAEVYDLVDGVVRRRVGLVLYDAAGERSPPAFKQRLVPLGETFFGWERWAWVRALAAAAAGYVPDFLPGEHTGVLELHAHDGRTYRLSGTLCFDNAHPEPYVDALRQGPVDFHLVASNEAWYRGSCEMDQMVAFSRLAALATGRSFVRATNSGISLVLGPDGREVGRARDASGADRSVAASGAWTVPVPAPGEPEATPYVRLGGLLRFAWIGLAGLCALLPRRAGNRDADGG